MRRTHRTALRTSALALAAALLGAPALAAPPPHAAESRPLTGAGLGPGGGSSPQLGAVEDALGPGRWHRTPAGPTWYGAYRTLGDPLAYCIDAGLRTPVPSRFRTHEKTVVESPETAWALWAHSASRDSDVQAALSAVAKLDDAVEHRHAIPPKHPKDLGEDFAGAARAYAEIAEDASELAGPYRVRLEETARSGAARTATVEISVLSASGALVPDADLTVAPDDARASTLTATSGREPVEVRLSAVGPKASLRVRADGLPATEVIVVEPTTPGSERVQNVIIRGEETSAAGRLAISEAAPRLPAPTYTAAPPTLPAPAPTLPAPVPTATAAPPTVTARPSPSPEPETPKPPAPESPKPPASPSAPPKPSPSPTASPPTTERPSPPQPEPTAPAPEEPTDRPSESPSAEPSSPAPTDSAPPAVPPEEADAPEETTPAEPGEGSPPFPEAEEIGDEPPEPSPTEPEGLPRTGSDPARLIGLALILIGGGVGALAVVTRRRS